MYKVILISIGLIIFISSCTDKKEDSSKMKNASIVKEEFIYEIENALTPQCHASTIAAAGDVLVAAWFGGTEEKNDDVGIWVSRNIEGGWSKPTEVVNGVQEDGSRYPCWNQ